MHVSTPITYRHWFVLLKYDHKLLYIILEILVKIWFEWTAFSSLESIHKLHWLGGVILGGMLFAHWCYFGAGAIALVFSGEEAIPTNSDNVNRIRRVSMVGTYDSNFDLEEVRKICNEEEDSHDNSGEETGKNNEGEEDKDIGLVVK